MATGCCVCGKGTKVVLVPLPPAVGRAAERVAGIRTRGPVLPNSRGTRMDRQLRGAPNPAELGRIGARHGSRLLGAPITAPGAPATPDG